MARCLNPVECRHYHTWPWAFGILSVAMLSLLGGCGPEPEAVAQPLAPAPSPAVAVAEANRAVQARARRLVVPADPVAVDLYTLDATCEGYQSELVQVPRQQSMETTVALILAEQQVPDLALSGYRTSFDPDTKTVTIDLRVARGSRRPLQSLSVCEQKALLGSLRETLLNQPDWKIEAVTFTNRGNPLVL
ncbi:MAG TPA: hypothetical protein VLS96_12715 [Nodosilinea sp.]|nr:hypothetical protein [Nodosilinea sp.]